MTPTELKDQALEFLHQNRETETVQRTIDWLVSHWKESLDALSKPVNSEDELHWLHCHAVVMRQLVTELDEYFEDTHG